MNKNTFLLYLHRFSYYFFFSCCIIRVIIIVSFSKSWNLLLFFNTKGENMRRNKLLILGAAFALAISGCANAMPMMKRENPLNKIVNITTTYVFTSKSWAATVNNVDANWTSGKDGAQLTSDRGVQVTTNSSGANATSPTSFVNVSQVVVTYSTNASKGAGDISIQIGQNASESKSVTTTGGTADRTLEWNYSPYKSGSLKLTVTCTTNSIYVKSVAVKTTNESSDPVQLNAPNPQYDLEFNRVVWEDVENAIGYEASINSEDDYDDATSPFDGNFQPGESYTVYVKAIGDGDDFSNSLAGSVSFTAVAPFVSKQYSLCTSIDDLEDGDSIVIGNGISEEVKFLSSTQNTNNRSATSALTVVDGLISSTFKTEIITLGKTGDNWTLYANNTPGYLYAVSSTENRLKTRDENSSKDSEWSIAIDSNGVASIVAQGTNTHNQLKNNGDLFACYENGQTDVSIWKEYDNTPRYTVTFDSNGGSSVPSQKPLATGTDFATEPEDPTKAGYDFAGWYKDQVCSSGQEYNFSAPVEGNLTLYAKWEKVALTTTYSASTGTTLLNNTGYRISGEVTVINSNKSFFIQDGSNAMQIYDNNAEYPALVSVGNVVDVYGTYNSSYGEITNSFAYCDIISNDEVNSQIPLTSLEDVSDANRNKYIEISQLQLGSAFSNRSASIDGEDSVTLFFSNESCVSGDGVNGAFSTSDYSSGDYVSVKGVVYIYNSKLEILISSIHKLSQCVVTFDTNTNDVDNFTRNVLEGEKVEQPTDPVRQPDSTYNYTFAGWYKDQACSVGQEYDFNSSVTGSLTLYAKWNATERTASDLVESLSTNASLSYSYEKEEGTLLATDQLTNSNLYDSIGGNTSTTYKSWTYDSSSGVSYAGLSAGENSTIQLRSKNSNEGLVSTENTNSHKAKQVTIEWHTSDSSRIVDVYGSNSPYTGASQLYNSNSQGTLIGSMAYSDKDQTTNKSTLTISSSFKYIGIRSRSGALYLNSIEIEWGTLPVFTYSNIAVRFGGLISESLWNELDTNEHVIEGFGVMVCDTQTLGNATLSKTNAQYDMFVPKATKAKPSDANDSQKGNLEGNYYVWTLRLNLANDYLTQSITAVAYIKTSSGYVYMQQTSASVRELALDYINNRGYQASDYEGSLGNLAGL